MNILKTIIEKKGLNSCSIELEVSGLIRSFEGNILETDAFPANVGSICQIEHSEGESSSAEIIGFRNNKNLIALHKIDTKIKIGAKVKLVDDGLNIKVGEELLGRVIDGMGNSLDGKAISKMKHTWPLHGQSINPLERERVEKEKSARTSRPRAASLG